MGECAHKHAGVGLQRDLAREQRSNGVLRETVRVLSLAVVELARRGPPTGAPRYSISHCNECPYHETQAKLDALMELACDLELRLLDEEERCERCGMPARTHRHYRGRVVAERGGTSG